MPSTHTKPKRRHDQRLLPDTIMKPIGKGEIRIIPTEPKIPRVISRFNADWIQYSDILIPIQLTTPKQVLQITVPVPALPTSEAPVAAPVVDTSVAQTEATLEMQTPAVLNTEQTTERPTTPPSTPVPPLVPDTTIAEIRANTRENYGLSRNAVVLRNMWATYNHEETLQAAFVFKVLGASLTVVGIIVAVVTFPSGVGAVAGAGIAAAGIGLFLYGRSKQNTAVPTLEIVPAEDSETPRIA